jgi:tetratricopeptide (TPR) repeat protein
MRTPTVLLPALSACMLFVSAFATSAQTPDAALPSGCKANPTGVSDAEAALYVEDWGKAAKLYHADAAQAPSSLEAQAGLVRVQLGRGDIANALKDATAMANASPQSVIAQTVLGETYIRRGELDSSTPILTRALALDPCYARTRLLAARIESLTGYHASAARHLAQAHALRPNDEQITLAWIFTLPPAQRFPLLKDFVGSAKYLDTDDREDLKSNVLEGEAKMNSHCTVSSLPGGTQTTIYEEPVMSKASQAQSIEATINGKKHRLHFSTSDADIFFPASTARALGLTPLVHVSYALLYQDGRLNYYYANLDSLRIGNVEYRNCVVKVLDEINSESNKADMDTNPSGADGSIGAMFLSDFLIRADPGKHLLTLSQLPPLGAKVDNTGLPLWSDISKSGGDPVPSINGGAWGQYNRIVPATMKDWTSLFRFHDKMWLPVGIGPGPQVLFELELDDPWPRLSTNAVDQTAKIETLVKNKAAAPFHGYFLEFAGLYFPITSWTAIRYDEFSKHLKLETSGTIGLQALHQTAFTLDLRDNLVQFVRATAQK